MENQEKKGITIELHPHQFDAFDFKTQFGVAIAGVRGGKTYVGSIWAGNKIVISKGNGLICAPDYKTLHDATLDTFFKLFPSYRRFYKEQKSIIALPDKTIFLRSLDDPLSAEGLTVDWAWGDEAGKYKLLAWHSLRSRVSLTKGQIFLTTTPYNMGWLYQEVFIPWQEKTDKDFSVFSWASIDNPYFPKDVYEAEKRRLRPEEFKRRYEGGFSRMQGLVYNLQSWHLVDEIPKQSEIILAGVDWGWTNPAAIIVIKFYQGQYTIVDEWYEVGKTTGQIIDKCIELKDKWHINRFYADSANPEKIAEASMNTGLYILPYEKKKDSITYGVSHINNLLLENGLQVMRGLKNTITEFESYQYPEPDSDGKVAKDEPMPFNNHLMDAMRYAIMGYMPAKRIKIPIETYTQENVRRMLNSRERMDSYGGEDYL